MKSLFYQCLHCDLNSKTTQWNESSSGFIENQKNQTDTYWNESSKNMAAICIESQGRISKVVCLINRSVGGTRGYLASSRPL